VELHIACSSGGGERAQTGIRERSVGGTSPITSKRDMWLFSMGERTWPEVSKAHQMCSRRVKGEAREGWNQQSKRSGKMRTGLSGLIQRKEEKKRQNACGQPAGIGKFEGKKKKV